MEYIQISGGNPLDGEVSVQKSKNAVLPMLAAVVLAEGRHIFEHCPKITDVIHMTQILQQLGCSINWDGEHLCIDNPGLSKYDISSIAAGRMRASSLFLGSLLGRYKQAVLPYPGGCVIGARPLNLHLDGLSSMQVQFEEKEKKIYAHVEELTGTTIVLPYPSVGATENLILAAVLAHGTTRICAAAREPEIETLVCMLRNMGAKITMEAPDTIVIEGVAKLSAGRYAIPADRIVAGTYLLAAAATRGRVVLRKAPVGQLGALEIALIQMGGYIRILDDTIFFDGSKAMEGIDRIETMPYPGFPTDLQSQLCAVLTTASSTSIIEETVFESRFAATYELNKMGADIQVQDRTVLIRPKNILYGANVQAYDLRGAAALVIAGLMAKGITRIYGCEFLTRGYESLVDDIQSLGGEITKMTE